MRNNRDVNSNSVTHQPYILGIDVGTNSIGWAVVDCHRRDINDNSPDKGYFSGMEPIDLRALNSRIFLQMVDSKTKIPNNQKRREARGTRNRLHFYKKQRQKLIKLLIKHHLLPQDFQQQPEQRLNEIDRAFAERVLAKAWDSTWTTAEKAHATPYAMRYFALEQRLEPFELGRVLLHLRQRRGYFSNRGAKYLELTKYLQLENLKDSEKQVDKETGTVLEGIGQLDKCLHGKTLGTFIWQQAMEKETLPQRINLHTYEKSKPVRGKDEETIERLNLFATREMYEYEFDKIMEAQQSDYPQLPVEEIRELIYFQRPLQLQKGKVGRCGIFPQKKRCHMAKLIFQEYRTWQIINNLKVQNPGSKTMELLNDKQRKTLFDACQKPSDIINKSYKIPFKAVNKLLGVKKCNYQSNNSDDKINGLPVNRTAIVLAKIVGKDDWQTFNQEKKQALVEDLLTIHSKKDLYKRLVDDWKFSTYQEQGDKSVALQLCLSEELEHDYAKYSEKAIRELNVHLGQGKNHYEALKEIDQLESMILDHRPHQGLSQLSPKDVPNIANPIVQKALYEIRRVVNSLIKRYGKPEIIRIELAREMKASKKHRSDIKSEQDKNRKRNVEVEQEILQLPTYSGSKRVPLKTRKKYKMWHDEQNKHCPYCTKPIGINQLFNGEAEIEHILPYTGFSQNYQNTLVSCRECNNHYKGDKTPYQTWGHDEERWGRIEAFAKKHFTGKIYPKQKRILDTKATKLESGEEFVERQLNDTAYIAKATKAMLQQYGIPIDVNNGQATAQLRKSLGLNNILPRRPEDNIYDRKEDILQINADKLKKLRHDHRHHAIDAFVVAITDRAMLKKLVDDHQIEQDRKKGLIGLEQHREEYRQTKDSADAKAKIFPKSWKGSWQMGSHTRQLVKSKIYQSVVSNMVKQKIYGALHEETFFGQSFYVEYISIDINTPRLKRIKALCEAKAFDQHGWIEAGELKNHIHQWVLHTIETPSKERKEAIWQDKKLEKIAYNMPCAKVRKPLSGELLVKISKEWRPGKGSWVAEKSTHEALYHWLEEKQLIGANITAIDQALLYSMPQILSKKGRLGPPIRSVTTAQTWGGSLIPLNQGKTYALTGSNHHIVIFNNGLEGKKRLWKSTMVSMLEAAKRAKMKQTIIRKTAPTHWQGDWHYQIHLCSQDLVKWEDEAMLDEQILAGKMHSSFKETPYFRVQKMSSKDDNMIDISFRHHSVSGTDNDWGLLRIQSLKNIKCQVVHIGNLGLFDD